MAGLEGADTELNCLALQSKGLRPWSPLGCRRGVNGEKASGAVAGNQAEKLGNR